MSFFFIYIDISFIFRLPLPGEKGVSQELALHPIHLTPDKEGNIPPSVLVPFCSYQGETSLLAKKIPELGFSTCDHFKARILDGQICHSLDVAKLVNNSSKPGIANGLFLLVDPNPYHLNTIEEKEAESRQDSFKIHIHTLAQYSALGHGSFGMTSLKRMTGTKSFEQLPEHQKKCVVHNREDCQTQKYLDKIIKECKCIPWAFQIEQLIDKVIELQSFILTGMSGYQLLWSRKEYLCLSSKFEGQGVFGSLLWTLC